MSSRYEEVRIARFLYLTEGAGWRYERDIQVLREKLLSGRQPDQIDRETIEKVLNQVRYLDVDGKVNWLSSPHQIPAAPSESDTYSEEFILHIFRKILSHGPLDRDTLMRELQSVLNHQVKDETTMLRSASFRGVIEECSGLYRLVDRDIRNYLRPFLKEKLTASFRGLRWKTEDDVIYDFTRYMGWAKTGCNIHSTTKSLIRGLLREGRLERQGQYLRRAA